MQKTGYLNTDPVQLFLQLMHHSSIARNTVDSLAVQSTVFNVINAHFNEKRNMLHQHKPQQMYRVSQKWTSCESVWITSVVNGIQQCAIYQIVALSHKTSVV